MRWLAWDELPDNMRVPEVLPYYDALASRRGYLVAKRLIDIAASVGIFALTWWVFLILAVAIKVESPGPVFYRQIRVTQYGRTFRIFKFRTMVQDAEKIGSAVTVDNDPRVTKVGSFIRKFRLDEFSQLIDVFRGTMTLVGTRPEVPEYVERYSPQMMATLLLPGGVTSSASISFKDEAAILDAASDVDTVYIGTILPEKMKCNLDDILHASLGRDVALMVRTVLAVLPVGGHLGRKPATGDRK